MVLVQMNDGIPPLWLPCSIWCTGWDVLHKLKVEPYKPDKSKVEIRWNASPGPPSLWLGLGNMLSSFTVVVKRMNGHLSLRKPSFLEVRIAKQVRTSEWYSGISHDHSVPSSIPFIIHNEPLISLDIRHVLTAHRWYMNVSQEVWKIHVRYL
jgi:hypothetical protein